MKTEKQNLYSIYHGMKNRCYNKNQIAYQKWYGNRGIKICKEWEKSFDSFYQWAINNGYQQGLSIDRIDNSKDYCPDNCRFVNAHTQVANRSTLKTNKTGYTGVELFQPKLWKPRKPYRAAIRVNGKTKCIGYYKTIEDAVKARNEYIKNNKLTEYPIQTIK